MKYSLFIFLSVITLQAQRRPDIWTTNANGTIQATSSAVGDIPLLQLNGASGLTIATNGALFMGDSLSWWGPIAGTTLISHLPNDTDFNVFLDNSGDSGTVYSRYLLAASITSSNIEQSILQHSPGLNTGWHIYASESPRRFYIRGESGGTDVVIDPSQPDDGNPCYWWSTLDFHTFGDFFVVDNGGTNLLNIQANGTATFNTTTIAAGNLFSFSNNTTNKVYGEFDGTIHAKDFVVTGSAFRPEDTSGNTAIFQAHDDDIAGAGGRKTFATLQNGSTPSLTIAPPSGGTVNLQGIFKAADGTSGVTQTNTLTIPGVLTNQVIIKNGIITSWISI